MTVVGDLIRTTGTHEVEESRRVPGTDVFTDALILVALVKVPHRVTDTHVAADEVHRLAVGAVGTPRIELGTGTLPQDTNGDVRHLGQFLANLTGLVRVEVTAEDHVRGGPGSHTVHRVEYLVRLLDPVHDQLLRRDRTLPQTIPLGGVKESFLFRLHM